MSRNATNGWFHPLFVIVAAGVAGGLVDAVYFSTMALIDSRTPGDVLLSIATFWPGKAAREGGSATAFLGAATHFGLATIMAAGFVAIARCSPALRAQPLTSGALYGVALYAVMYFVVLPLRWPHLFPRFDGWRSLLDVGIHIGVGIAIAWTVSAMTRR